MTCLLHEITDEARCKQATLGAASQQVPQQRSQLPQQWCAGGVARLPAVRGICHCGTQQELSQCGHVAHK